MQQALLGDCSTAEGYQRKWMIWSWGQGVYNLIRNKANIHEAPRKVLKLYKQEDAEGEGLCTCMIGEDLETQVNQACVPVCTHLPL